MPHVHSNVGELYYLKMLLTIVKDPRSFWENKKKLII